MFARFEINRVLHRENATYGKGVQTLFTVIGILGLVFVAFAFLFVVSLIAQVVMKPFAPKLAKKYDHLKGMMPAGPPRPGHAQVIQLEGSFRPETQA